MCGIRNPATRKKLLSQDRTFQEAVQVAPADEIAAKETLQVQEQQIPDVTPSAKKRTFSLATFEEFISDFWLGVQSYTQFYFL